MIVAHNKIWWVAIPMMVALTLIALLTACVHHPQDPAREALLSLPYKEFDQTPDSGWRTLSKQNRNREAVVLIEEYLKRHPQLAPIPSGMLHFHAAQLLAAEDRETRRAIAHLKQARCEGQIPGYNEFADAMRAFLERDYDELLVIRDRVRGYPATGMTKVYQSVVESFVERVDGSYNDVMAYEAAKKKR